MWRSVGLKLHLEMHPQTDERPSHYAHLADALRYAYLAGHEWSMVVEDDFVVCGPWGMEGVARVLLELGSTLVSDGGDRPSGISTIENTWGAGEKRPARWRGVFVGTGGRCEFQSCIFKCTLTVS